MYLMFSGVTQMITTNYLFLLENVLVATETQIQANEEEGEGLFLGFCARIGEESFWISCDISTQQI